jgi:DNA-binding transcriptional LysR family regulator
MNDRILTLKVFVRVAHSGSFSKAAEQLGLSQPTISRMVSTLERDLKTPLISRTTRSTLLTVAGNHYLQRIEPILLKLEEANCLAKTSGALLGTLRVSLSSGLAAREVIPHLKSFRALHPALKLELILNEKPDSIVRDGIDVALINGELSDSTAVCRRVSTEPRVVVASPAYLDAHGKPQTPADIAEHQIISCPFMTDQRTWTLRCDDEWVSVKPRVWLKISVEEAAVIAAKTGLGLLMCSQRACHRELASQELIEVLPHWSAGSSPLFALFPAGRTVKRTAKVFIEYLAPRLHSAG